MVEECWRVETETIAFGISAYKLLIPQNPLSLRLPLFKLKETFFATIKVICILFSGHHVQNAILCSLCNVSHHYWLNKKTSPFSKTYRRQIESTKMVNYFSAQWNTAASRRTWRMPLRKWKWSLRKHLIFQKKPHWRKRPE